MIRFTNVYGEFHLRWHIQNCQFDCVTAEGRESESSEIEWYGNDVISFHKFMAPHFFSHAPFFDRSFPLAVPSECSIIIMDIQSSKWWIRKTKKMRKKNSMEQFFCEDETDGVLVRPSKKRNSIFDVCAMCDVYGKIAWIAFVCSFTKSRHSYFNGTIFDPFSRCTAVTLIFRCWRF